MALCSIIKVNFVFIHSKQIFLSLKIRITISLLANLKIGCDKKVKKNE